METWLKATLQTINQKLKLAEAIRYTLARWEGLNRFVDDGTIEMDSNTIERSIRPVTPTRKNALFAGSDGGAEHWAAVASLIETCELNAVDPEAQLGATINRIVQALPQSRIDELMPWPMPPDRGPWSSDDAYQWRVPAHLQEVQVAMRRGRDLMMRSRLVEHHTVTSEIKPIRPCSTARSSGSCSLEASTALR